MLNHCEVFCSQLDNRVGEKCIAIAMPKKRSPFVDKNRLSTLSLPTQKKRSSSLTKTIAHSPIISTKTAGVPHSNGTTLSDGRNAREAQEPNKLSINADRISSIRDTIRS